jgi:hypothetical protein
LAQANEELGAGLGVRGDRDGGLFAVDAGAGEETTEARGVFALRLNEKFLALEVAWVLD